MTSFDPFEGCYCVETNKIDWPKDPKGYADALLGSRYPYFSQLKAVKVVLRPASGDPSKGLLDVSYALAEDPMDCMKELVEDCS